MPDRHGPDDNYCELIALRNDKPDLSAKDATFSSYCNVSDWDNGRFIYASTPQKELVCVINPTTSTKTIDNAICVVIEFICDDRSLNALNFEDKGCTVFRSAEGYVSVPKCLCLGSSALLG